MNEEDKKTEEGSGRKESGVVNEEDEETKERMWEKGVKNSECGER